MMISLLYEASYEPPSRFGKKLVDRVERDVFDCSCQTLNILSTYQPMLSLEGCVKCKEPDRLRKIFLMAWRGLAILILIKMLGHRSRLEAIGNYLTKWGFRSHGHATIGVAIKARVEEQEIIILC